MVKNSRIIAWFVAVGDRFGFRMSSAVESLSAGGKGKNCRSEGNSKTSDLRRECRTLSAEVRRLIEDDRISVPPNSEQKKIAIDRLGQMR